MLNSRSSRPCRSPRPSLQKTASSITRHSRGAASLPCRLPVRARGDLGYVVFPETSSQVRRAHAARSPSAIPPSFAMLRAQTRILCVCTPDHRVRASPELLRTSRMRYGEGGEGMGGLIRGGRVAARRADAVLDRRSGLCNLRFQRHCTHATPLTPSTPLAAMSTSAGTRGPAPSRST